MKIHKLRFQFFAALAFVPLMLFGCSSSEESTDTADTSGDSSGDKDCAQFDNPVDVKECEVWNDLH
jgi:hypothetical protein